jgi:hypothetical protein
MTRALDTDTDRRAPNVRRVDLTTLVEICGQDGVVPAFEAESCNVSGHGMQVRTSFLPEIGDGLVCRFEHKGSEVLVEGRVAWRAEGEDGGEFGIQFTALDAASVDVLGSLALKSAPRHEAALVEEEEEDTEEAPRVGAEPGSRVRLHIDGLGAPMKARVHDGNPRKVRVGSNLEFLKVGRTLEIEDVQGGVRQGAHVDSVSVAMNPSTKVPELVVVLRYEGAEATPAPSVVDSLGEVAEAKSVARPSVLKSAALRSDDSDVDDDDYDHEGYSEEEHGSRFFRGAEALRKRIEDVARGASHAARGAQDVIGRVGGSVAGGAVKLAQGAGAQIKKGREQGDVRRRTAAPPPTVRSSVQALRGTSRPEATTLRPQRPMQSRAAAAPERAPAAAAAVPHTVNKRRLGTLAAGALVLVVGSAFALRGSKDEPAALAAAPQTAPAAPAASAPVQPNAVAPNAPAAIASAAPAALAAAAPPGGVIAEVPLFGPKAMATSEPAPLADAPDTATAERLAAAAAAPDEAWEDEAPKETASAVKPWGRGKLHLPTIHRIRLDSAGAQLAGAIESTGFTIVVPGRKAMESGRNIEKRDKRIAQVKASNTDRGASISFKFRGKVPAYRVRLNKDFIEFLISAPEGEGAHL